MYQFVVTRLVRFLTFSAMLLILSACGQGSGPEPVPGTPQESQSGVLLDSPVSGISWTGASGTSGITTMDGEFDYVPFESITFSVGGIELGTVQGAPFVTVVELTNSSVPTSQAAVNMLVFLQSIDSDGDPSNGITVSSTASSAAASLSLDFMADDFAMRVPGVISAMMGPDAEVVSEADALNHFYTTYVAFGGTDTLSFFFPGYPPVGGAADTFELIFADEFEQGDAPDPEVWNLETGYGPNNSGWGNNEWQLYTNSPDNVRVEDGNLVIQARCDTPPCGSRDGTVTSSRLTTQDKFEFRYGKVVARIKPPVGEGSWPAFWALGANFPEIGWPRSGEIDFMEMFQGLSDPNTTHSTIHWCDQTIQAPAVCSFPDGRRSLTDSRSFSNSLGDDFQIWEADWDENGITMSINGIEYFDTEFDPATMEEFTRDFFLILNVAMGGTLGSNNQLPSGNEVWPQTMLVDYVRVFQNMGGGGATVQTFGFEDAPDTYTFNAFGGGAAAVVDNPQSDASNSSAQVVRMQKFDGEVFAGTTFVPPQPIVVSEGGIFTMNVWSPRPVMVLFKLEGENEAEINLPHGGTGWEEMSFDFSNYSGTATGISIIFDLGIVGDAMGDAENWTFLVDDITFFPPGTGGGGPGGGPAQISLPITFDDANVDYTVIDFGDPVPASTTLTNDPLDASNTVARTVKPVGTPVWAGTTMSTESGLASAIPFTMNDTTIGVRVFSPAAGLPIRLKADNVVNGDVSVETETLTSVANQWETLIFDFSNPVADTAALDLSVSYQALSIFFNFGTSGDDAGELTFFWDDVEFNPDTPADVIAPTLTSVSVTSSNASPELARVGDTFTVTFTASEPLVAPTVTVGDNSADAVTGADTQWEATRVLTAADVEGAINFAIGYADLAGNDGVVVTESSDGSMVTLDASVPSVVITGDSLGQVVPFAEDVTFEFSEAVTGFELSDIVVTNGTASALQSNDGIVYSAAIAPADQGTVSISVAEGAAVDAAGNPSAAAAEVSFVFDSVFPAVTISGIPDTFSTLDPIVVALEFTEDVNNVETALQVAGGAVAEFLAIDGANYQATIVPDGSGNLVVTLTGAGYSDNAGNLGDAVAITSLIDAVAPTLAIDGLPADFNTLDPITLSLIFSESVTGLDLTDLQVTNGTAANLIEVDAANYTVEITPDGGGDLSVAVAAGAAQDGVGNPSAAATSSTALIDAVAPTVTLSGAPTEFTTLAPIALTIEFSEAVFNVDAADFAVTNGAASGLVAVDADSFTVNVTPTGAGDLTVVLPAGAAQDGVGNDSTESNTITVTNSLDTEAPLLTAVSISSSNANTGVATAGDVITIDLTANEDITEPTVTIAGQPADSVTGAGVTWQATRTVVAGDAEGAVSFTLDYADLESNQGPQATVTTDGSTVAIDLTAPTLVIEGLPASFDMLDPLTATFQFSEDVTGFELTDISVSNGAASAFAAVDASTYTASITPDGNGSVTVSVAASAAQDLAGLQSTMPADVVVSNQVDDQPPSLSVVSIASSNADPAAAAVGDTVTLSLTADEAISEPVITLAGAAAAVSGADTTWTASRVLTDTDTEGAVVFTIDFADVAGNAGAQVTATTDGSIVTFDRTSPSLAITGLPAAYTSLDPIAVTFTFSEAVSGFEDTDVSVTNGSLDAVVSVDAATYTANVTPAGTGDLTVAVADDAASDGAGNLSSADSVTATEDLPPAWQLVWSDSFDGAALDTANWSARTNITCPDPCEGEQSYNTNNVSVAGGVLTINVQESVSPPYISGFIDSRGKRELKFGRVEIDARMPGTQGTVPSLFLLPASDTYGAWPLSGQINLATAPDLGVGGNTDVEQALVYGLPTPEETTTSGSYTSPTAPDAQFIEYAIEWEDGEIRWFVDDVHVLTQSDDNWYTYTEDDSGVYAVGADTAPFDEQFYLALAVIVDDSANGTSLFPQTLEVDEVRVYECANAVDPVAGTGCSTGDPAVMPVSAPSEPFTATTDLYVNGPTTLTFVDDTMGTELGTLVATTAVSDVSVTVASNPTAADPDGGTLWNLDFTASTGTGDALIQPGDFTGFNAFFNVANGDTAGELLFRMRMNSMTGTPTLSVGLDDTAGGSGSVEVTAGAMNEWVDYSVKLADILTDSVASASALDMTQVFNAFRLSAAGGSINVDIDDIALKVACRDTDGCSVTPTLDPLPETQRYLQTFDNLDMSGNAIGDGWIFFNTVFEGTLALFSYNGPAPNGPQICALVNDQGGLEQGTQQLSMYSDYECCQPSSGHNSTSGVGFVQTNVFREETLTAADVGKSIRFQFDLKRGNIENAAKAFAFIKVLDPNSGFSETVIDEVEVTATPESWNTLQLQIDIGEFEGQLLQYGFKTEAGNFDGSGIFYDNVVVTDIGP